MGSQGDSSREEGKRSKPALRLKPSGLGVVLAVVTVVLILLLAVMYTAWVEFPDQDGPEPETIEDGVTVIRGDVVWEGRSGILDNRVDIRSRGSLRIVDCDLRILLEDLAASHEDWFSVEGELTIESSRLEIWKDSRLDRALAFEGKLRDPPMEAVPPYIFRAINLKGATEPLLALDTRVFGDGGEMTVAYQEAPGEDLQVLTMLEVQVDPVEVWQHHEVSLASLRGSIVNLFIIGHDPDLGRYLLGNLRVTDGDGDLPGDIHFSGFPDEDRWAYVLGSNVLERLRHDRWGDLIGCTGTLTIRDSNLTCPRDIDHTYSAPIHGDIKFNEYDPEEAPVLYYKMKDGGDIDAADADVVIERSGLEHVLLRARDSELAIRDVQFTGDREIMTAYRCSGTVEGTTFLGQHDRSDTTARWYDGPRFWGLAVWYQRNGGTFNITDCTFIDTPLGLDLTHTAARVAGCTFVNCSFMGIWDHNTTGLDDWDALNSTCDFDECRGTWYTRSHNGRANITAPWMPDDWSSLDHEWRTDGQVRGVDAGQALRCEALWVFRAWAHMYVPTFSASRWAVSPISEMYVNIVSNWGGGTVATLDTSLSWFDIGLPGNGSISPASKPTDTFFRIEDAQLNGTGVLDLYLHTTFLFRQSSREFAAPSDLVIHQYLNDELVRTYSADETDRGGNFIEFDLETSTDIHPGANRVEFVLEGIPYGSVEPEELARNNRTYLRLTGSEDLDALIDEYAAEYPEFIIDTGVQVELDCANPALSYGEEEYYIIYISLLTEEGSSVTLTDSADRDILDLTLMHEGPGDLRILDIDVQGSYLNIMETDLLVVDSSLGDNYCILSLSDIHMRNVTFDSRVSLWIEGCNLTFEDSHVFSESVSLSAKYSNLTLVNNTFSGEGEPQIYLGTRENGTTTVANCTFDGSVLDLGLTDFSHRLVEVRDCLFRNGAVLEAPIHQVRDYLTEPLPDELGFLVTNVTITGEGSGFIGHILMHEAVKGGFVLEDGALSKVYLDTQVLLQPWWVDDKRYIEEVVPIADDNLVDWEMTERDEYILFRSLHGLDEDGQIGDAVHLRIAISGENFYFGVEPIVWFDTIYLTAPNTKITVPLWGYSLDLVRDLLEDLGLFGWWVGD